MSNQFVQLHRHAAVISYSELVTRTLKTRLCCIGHSYYLHAQIRSKFDIGSDDNSNNYESSMPTVNLQWSCCYYFRMLISNQAAFK